MTTRITEGAEPKHQQLRRILLDLATVRLTPGAAIPSERQLIQEYGVSRITVREALGQLVNEGYLERVRGKGTFVAHRPALRLGETDTAYHLKRLRMADGAPVSIDDAWLSASAFPGLLDHDLSGSVYSLAATEYRTPIDRAQQTVAAKPAADDVATLLGTKTGAPVLEFDRVSYSGDRPVEHSRSWYRSDRYRVQMEVTATRPVA
jgi:GntR family transcriptional regulator